VLDTSPTTVDVEFDGIGDDDCTDCDQAAPNGYNNATYSLTKDSDCEFSGPGECSHNISATVIESGGSYFWQIAIWDGAVGSTSIAIYFSGPPESPYLDCTKDYTSVSLSSSAGTECDFTGSTCDITTNA